MSSLGSFRFVSRDAARVTTRGYLAGVATCPELPGDALVSTRAKSNALVIGLLLCD